MKRILRTQEAADYVGLARTTLEKMRARGGGPAYIQLGGRAVGYDIRDLDEWLDGQRRCTCHPGERVGVAEPGS